MNRRMKSSAGLYENCYVPNFQTQGQNNSALLGRILIALFRAKKLRSTKRKEKKKEKRKRKRKEKRGGGERGERRGIFSIPTRFLEAKRPRGPRAVGDALSAVFL